MRSAPIGPKNSLISQCFFKVRVFTGLFFAGCLGVTLPGAEAANSKQEIKVTLFGQTCTMSGPYPTATLQWIHEVSPEKVPPDQTLEQMKKVRSKLAGAKSVSPEIDLYRDHLRKRISAKIAFEEAIREAKKKGNTPKSFEIFMINVKEHITPTLLLSFETSMKKQFAERNSIWEGEFAQALKEKFEESIQPETEEEFHKAIRKSNIQYGCNFDEGADDDHEEEEDESESPTPSAAASPKSSPAPKASN